MSDTSHDPDAGAQDEGGYGYPTLEQEVTPEVLEGAESDGSRDSTGVGTEPARDGGGDAG